MCGTRYGAVGNVEVSYLQTFRAAPEGSARLQPLHPGHSAVSHVSGFSCQDFPACEEAPADSTAGFIIVFREKRW